MLRSIFIGWSLENCMSRKHLVDKKIISWCFVPSGREFVFNQAIHHTFVPFVSFALLLGKDNHLLKWKRKRRQCWYYRNAVVKAKTATMGKKIRWQQIHNASNVDDNVAVLRYFFLRYLIIVRRKMKFSVKISNWKNDQYWDRNDFHSLT